MKLNETEREVVNRIIKDYQDSDVCMYEFLNGTMPSQVSEYELPITSWVKIFAEVMKVIEGDFLVRGNMEEDWFDDFEKQGKISLNTIENWWKHLGCYDREQASNIEYDNVDCGKFLTETDDWWDSLTDKEKENVYEEFFSEN